MIGLTNAELSERGISRLSLGTVDFQTGAIVAADPVVQPERPAFARKVQPGRYDVEVFEVSRRVALLVVRFAPWTPERWQMALLPGQDSRTLKTDEIFYYPVDPGLGTLVDAKARDALIERNRREEARRSDFDGYDDVVAAPLKAAGDRMVLLKPLADDPAIVPIV